MIVPDWILYAWFALAAASTAYVAWDNFVRTNPEETVMKWGPDHALHGPRCLSALRAGRQGALPGHARGVRPAALEARRRLDGALHRRRRERHHRGGRDYGTARLADVDRLHRRVCGRL